MQHLKNIKCSPGLKQQCTVLHTDMTYRCNALAKDSL